MTTTRTNHTGHDHPNTTAARTACRKATAGLLADAVDAYRKVMRSQKWNDSRHRTNVTVSMNAVAAYAKATGMDNRAAADKVSEIARSFD